MNPTDYDTPFQYCPELKEEYLIELAQNILKVVERTANDLNSKQDDNYTRETCIFGRVRQLFIQLDMDKSKPWVIVPSKSMDYVARVCGVPIRVFKDDPASPRKKKVFFRNEFEQHQLSLFAEEEANNGGSSITWRLFIQAPATVSNKGDELEDLEDDYRVVFVGYNSYSNEIKAMWQSTTEARDTLHLINDELPEAKPVRKQPLKPKDIGKDSTASGNE